MGLMALHTLLWLLTALTLTTQEFVRLSVSPKIAAECEKQVTLNCNVSSSRNGLSIKHMDWSLNRSPLCSVNTEGTMTTHQKHNLSDFHCEYEHGQLSVIFGKVQPLESGNYTCKIRSNQGVGHNITTVELQECSGIVESVSTTNGHICTFHHVYPDGDVHWFYSSHHISDRSLHNTTKQVVKGGWLTIHSYLERKGTDKPYSCCLKSTKSGRYIASALFQNPRVRTFTRPDNNGVGSQGPMRTFLCISILLAVILK